MSETMEEKKVTTLFEEMKSDVTSYVTNTLELGKLGAFEKISKGSSIITYFIIVGVIVFMALTMLLLTLALYLGEVLQSMWMGFGIVSAAILLTLVIIVLSKKSLKRSIANGVVNFLMETDDDDNVNKQ